MSMIGFSAPWLHLDLVCWALAQASVVAVAAYLLVVTAKNTSAARRVPISLMGLLLMAVIPMSAILRSEGWSLGEWLPDASDQQQVATNSAVPPENEWVAPTSETPTQEDFGDRPLQVVAAGLSELFVAPTELPVDQETLAKGDDALPSTSMLLAICVCFGVAIGSVRLLLGYVQIRVLRLESKPLADDAAKEVIQECATELGLPRGVSTAISKRVSTPAVIGWRHPTLLFPANWTDWTQQELRAIVAHELAHVKRSDFLTTACAQLALAVNFFHPLAHLVLRRMRLDQELAADTLAASLVGGQKNYIQILASLALRQPRVRTPGPAQAFLPPRRMFVRRLEMLRTVPKQSGSWATIYSLTAAVSLVAVALLATGLRPRSLAAQEPTSNSATSTMTDLKPLLEYVPAGFAKAIIHFDAKTLLSSGAMKSTRDKLELPAKLPFAGQMLALDDIDSAMVVIPSLAPGQAGQPLMIVRSKNAEKWEVDDTVRVLDAHTVAVHPQPDLLGTLGQYPVEPEWAGLLSREKTKGISLALKMDAVQAIFESGPWPKGEMIWSFAPIWQDVETLTAGLELDNDVAIVATLDSKQSQNVAATLTALRTLGQNLLTNYADAFSSANPRAQAAEQVMYSAAIGYASQLLKEMKIEAAGNQVKLQSKMKDAAGPVLAATAPAIVAARVAAQRTQSMNNMKQIMLALHNYHAAYNHFPPAVVKDKESGVERSWRVEILPFIDQVALYQLYQKDKPWDSPENLKVLESMPLVFAAPGMTFDLSKPRDQQASLTGYLAITSEDGGLTLVNGKPPRLRDFTDGTSNTAVIVETTSMVPWTKPIDMEDATNAPQMGSVRTSEPGIPVAFADGSVRFIANVVDAWVWKALTTRSGGEATRELP